MKAKYLSYPEYNKSEVTWYKKVPSHWELVRFKRVLLEKKKTTNPRLNAGSISFGNVIYKNNDQITPETKASYQEVLSGEFLINPLNMNYDLISLRTALSLINVVVSTGYIVIKSTDDLLKNYTRWLLQEFDVAHMKTLGSGVRQTINYTDIGNSFFYKPSIQEQQKIANFLDHETAKIDTLIEKQQQLIQLLKEKRQAVISHAVTKGLNPNASMRDSGVEWLGEVPEHWVITKIKYTAELTPKKSELEIDKTKMCNFIPMEKLKTDSLILDEHRLIDEVFGGYTYFKNEDVLMAKVTPCFENKNMVVARGLINGIGFGSSEIYVLRPRIELLNDFLYYRIQENIFIELGTGAMIGAGGLKRVPADFINNFVFALPPENERVDIVDYIKQYTSKFDSLMEKAFEAIEFMLERRTALISAAVTGKIDVRNWQAPEPN